MTSPERSFDRIATVYERVRPGYPEAVFDRMLDFAALSLSAPILDVGAGTGKATVPLAERGFRILALEPGSNLAQIARSRLAAFAGVDVLNTSFEDWDGPSDSFGLAVAAQAYHWLPEEQRIPKFARVLCRSGTLAVFGNSARIAEGPLRAAIEDAYRRCAPTLCGVDRADAWYGSPQSPALSELRSSPLFCDACFDFFPWDGMVTTSDFCDLISTYSDHSTLPSEQLRQLLAHVATAVDDHGGLTSIRYTTGLFMARAV